VRDATSHNRAKGIEAYILNNARFMHFSSISIFDEDNDIGSTAKK